MSSKASKKVKGKSKTRKFVPRPKTARPGRVDLYTNEADPAKRVKVLAERFAKALQDAPARGVLWPAGTMSPNMAGAMIGVTGEAIKQWIYHGRMKTARLPNGYHAIKPEHLAEAVVAPSANAEFTLQKGTGRGRKPKKAKKK